LARLSVKKLAVLVLLWSLAAAALAPLPGRAENANPNLVPNPDFADLNEQTGLPAGWRHPPRHIPGVVPGKVYFCRVAGYPGRLLALEGGGDRNGRVSCRIKGIKPHRDYLLEFAAYRPKFTNGVYLEVEIFGQRLLINQHFSYGRIQAIFLRINSGRHQGAVRLAIMNPHPEVLAFGSPSLKLAAAEPKGPGQSGAVRLPAFFPVGIYDARPQDLPAIRDAGFNAVQSYASRPQVIDAMAAQARKLGLKYLANVKDCQPAFCRKLGGRPELLGFYIEDEPEGRSVPPEQLAARKQALQRDHPGVLTATAMLRSQMVAAYKAAADVFLLDPYPVPHMPMTWLSDTLAEAARYVPEERLWAVIQAFGGGRWAEHGWPRRPSGPEMRCLTYLALVHGAHGLFYFSYPEVHQDPAAWQELTAIVRELRQLRTWLVLPNEAADLDLEVTSPFRTEASGGPAVHFCRKRRGQENLLILVNVLNRPVSFALHGFPPQVPCLAALFHEKKTVVRQQSIREELAPYEVRLYSFRQGH
jgi:hypothetical protein